MASELTLPPIDPPHRCRPAHTMTTNPTAYDYAPVVACSCGRRFVLRSDWVEGYRWVRLRWWHRPERRRLAALNKEPGGHDGRG